MQGVALFIAVLVISVGIVGCLWVIDGDENNENDTPIHIGGEGMAISGSGTINDPFKGVTTKSSVNEWDYVAEYEIWAGGIRDPGTIYICPDSSVRLKFNGLLTSEHALRVSNSSLGSITDRQHLSTGSSDTTYGCATINTGSSTGTFNLTNARGAIITTVIIIESPTPTIPVNVGGSWKDATPYVNVNGAWKEVTNAYVNVGGTWREVS